MKPEYKNLFFDMDGTLNASYPGIRRSMLATFERFGVQIDEETIKTFIGPPVEESFARYFPVEKLGEIREFFSKFYFENGVFDLEVYDGIPETLEALKKDGYSLYVATSKREDIAIDVAKHFDLYKYFDRIFGAGRTERRKKEEVLAYGLAEAGASSKDSLMIGDTVYDLKGAHICGLPCVFAAYGYGTDEQVKAYPYVFKAETPISLIDFLV